MKNVRMVLAGALALTALVAAGCGDDDKDKSSDAKSTATSTVVPKVAFVAVALFDYQQAEIEGMNSVLKAAGGDPVKVFNANFDPQKTLSMCKDAVDSGRYNSIILSSLEPTSGVPCVTLAKEAGIPVAGLDMTIGKDFNDPAPQVPGVVGGVYSIPKSNAEGMVKLTTDACQGVDPCKVIVEVATPTDPLTNGVVDALKQIPNVDVVATVATGFDPGVISAKLPDLVAAHKDVNVFVAVQDATAQASLPVFAKAGLEGKVKVIGNGGSRGGAAAVKSGDMFATTGSWPRQQGEIVTNMLIKALNKQEISPNGLESAEVDDPDYVTSDTVDEFKPEWGAQGS